MITAKILNPEQTEAVHYGKGPLLIIAGAGTGKTTVITERIKHLILNKDVLPSEILALTFTEKSAREMEERVDIALPYGYTQMWISTFHAFCDRVLRDEAVHIGLNPGYKLSTEAEIILFLRQMLFKFELEYFRPLGNPHKFLDGLFQHFSRLKDEDISPEAYLTYAQNISNSSAEPDEIKKTKELAKAYNLYEELKVQEGMMDFGDLISNTLKLFRTRKNVLRQYQDRFKYVLVDEFQDTNFAQNTLAMLLTGERKNITVVGDDDQAIYRWRGAAISNIIHFRKHYPEAKIITLTRNYRSTSAILDASYHLIQNNNPDRLEIQEQVDKKLIPMNQTEGKPVTLLLADRVENEAEQVATIIQDLTRKKKYQYKDIALLVRANDYSQAFVRAFLRLGIPYQFLGPGHLFHQDEIKDLIAYLKVLYNFEDSTSLYRILNLSIFEIEPRDVAALLNLSRRKNRTLFETLEKVSAATPDNQEILFSKPQTLETLKKVCTMITKHVSRVPKDTAGQILYYFMQDTGLLQKFLSPKTQADEKRYQNIARFFDKLKTFEAQRSDSSIFAVVDWIDLSMQMGESPLASDMDWTENNAVNILTVHSSKGLEFPVVFLVNLVTQRFPSRERREQIPIPEALIKEILPVGDFHLQEERRLCYVGITRAKELLYFTAANFYGEGKRERTLSPFVAESLGEEVVAHLIEKEKAKKVVIQPSLLDWAPLSAEPDKSVHATKSTSFMNRITYLSYSQMKTFEICPLHYKLRYILKLPAPYTAAQSYGTSIHCALRDFFQRVKNGEELSIESINPLLDQQWIDEGYTSKEHEISAKKQAEVLLSNYLEKNYTYEVDSINTLSVEMPFQFTIRGPNGWQSNLKVGGRFDRINKLENGKIEILDYKTGSNTPTEKELQTDLQLTMYALAATEIRDPLFQKKPEDIILTLHYLDVDQKFITTRTKEQLETVKQELRQKAEEISKSDFVCSGSNLCQLCEYKMLCTGITTG